MNRAKAPLRAAGMHALIDISNQMLEDGGAGMHRHDSLLARALQARLGLPVRDMYGFCCRFHAGLNPRGFGPPGSAAGA